MLSLIDVDPDTMYQIMTMNITVKEQKKRIRLELRYLEAPETWYISVYDAQSGNPICLYVPVISCWDDLNDLFAPYAYKDIGQIVCVPMVDEPSSVNPTKHNWSEFALVWSDDFNAE